jgi:hypothetical protein
MTSAKAPPTGKLAPRQRFYSRLWWSVSLGTAMMAGMLVCGTVGYHLIDNFGWLDAFHQSAMLLAGMGPVKEISTVGGKVFDSLYALACALIMLGAAGVVFAPVIHRILHRFHIEDVGSDS